MTTLTAKKILEALPLVEGSKNTYPFLHRVTQRIIERELSENLSKSQLNAFALLLLFVDYRAANAQPYNRAGFTTKVHHNSYQEKRFRFFNRHFDPVTSTDQYCKLLKIGFVDNILRSLMGKSIEDHIYRVIIDGV